MNRLFASALVMALSAAPAMARAETQNTRGTVSAPASRDAQASPSPADAQNPADDAAAADYSQREEAAPQLGEFQGGADGIYIGAGALAVALIVVLLITAF